MIKPIDLSVLVETILAHAPKRDGGSLAPLPSRAARVALAPDATPATTPPVGIDLDALVARYGNRVAWIDNLLRLTLEHYAPTPEALRQAAAQADVKAIAVLAHRIRSGVGTIEARALFEFAGRVEQRAKKGADEAAGEVAVLACELAERLEQLLEGLRARGLDARVDARRLDGVAAG